MRKCAFVNKNGEHIMFCSSDEKTTEIEMIVDMKSGKRVLFLKRKYMFYNNVIYLFVSNILLTEEEVKTLIVMNSETNVKEEKKYKGLENIKKIRKIIKKRYGLTKSEVCELFNYLSTLFLYIAEFISTKDIILKKIKTIVLILWNNRTVIHNEYYDLFINYIECVLTEIKSNISKDQAKMLSDIFANVLIEDINPVCIIETTMKFQDVGLPVN
jgi:hypothetical protein